MAATLLHTQLVFSGCKDWGMYLSLQHLTLVVLNFCKFGELLFHYQI